MKKHNYISKTVVCLLAVSLSVVLFAGCQSQSASNAANQTTNSTTQNSNKKPSADDMKKRIQDNIQPLITAGTITQDQADKIVTAMTTRPQGNGQQNGQQNNNQNNQQGNTQNNGGQRQRRNPLSTLVSDGTITQAQADAVMQKMGGNFGRNNKGQNSQSSNQSTTSN